MPPSPTEAYIRSACQFGFTLESVALERVIISTSGQDDSHKKKNGKAFTGTNVVIAGQVTAKRLRGAPRGREEFL